MVTIIIVIFSLLLDKNYISIILGGQIVNIKMFTEFLPQCYLTVKVSIKCPQLLIH